MLSHRENDDIVTDPSWSLKYGNYTIRGKEEAQALMNSDAVVNSVDVVYDKKHRLLRYFPKGTFFCSKCQKHVGMCASTPAYIEHLEHRVYLSHEVICHDCLNRAKTYLPIEFQFDTICSLRYQAQKHAERVAPKRALRKLRPYVMEWACQPDGPCYRVALSRWPKS
jgi:hypothetical protein